MTNGQKTLTKGRIGGANFSRGQCNVTPTSREHCSRLQQWRCHAVIENWMIPLLHTSQQRFPMLINGPDNSPRLPLSRGNLDAILGSHMSQPQTASRSVFAQLTRVPSTDRETDRHTDHATCDICSNRAHLIHAMHVMRPNINQVS